jgi:O-antigen ligase
MSDKTGLAGFLDGVSYWMIILLPFSMAIAPAPMNVFMGLLLAAFLAKKILKKERVFADSALNMPVLLLFIITCLSAFNSICLRETIKGGILRLLQYILVFTIVREEVKDRAHLKKILISMSLGAILASSNAIFQVAAGRDFVRGFKPILNLDLVRATANFKDANILGIYLSALAPILFGLTLFYFRGRKKIAMCLLSLTVLTAIALTYSRPTLLAIYVILFFFGFARKSKALIAVLIVFTLASPFLLPQSVKNWARDVEYNPLRFMCNDDRIAVYRNSLLMIKAHPIIGAGANTFMRSYRFYKESPEYRGIVTLDEMKAHNNFLHMAGEIGLTGLGIFTWILYRLFQQSRRIYNSLEDDYLKLVSLSLIACLIAFLVNGLTESSLYYSVVALLFWYLAGLSLSIKKFTAK